MTTTAVPMRFRDKLRELRLKAGLSQQGLADQTGIPVSTLRNYEQGWRQPNWRGLLNLAKGLGVSADEFAGCQEEE